MTLGTLGPLMAFPNGGGHASPCIRCRESHLGLFGPIGPPMASLGSWGGYASPQSLYREFRPGLFGLDWSPARPPHIYIYMKIVGR